MFRNTFVSTLTRYDIYFEVYDDNDSKEAELLPLSAVLFLLLQ